MDSKISDLGTNKGVILTILVDSLRYPPVITRVVSTNRWRNWSCSPARPDFFQYFGVVQAHHLPGVCTIEPAASCAADRQIGQNRLGLHPRGVYRRLGRSRRNREIRVRRTECFFLAGPIFMF